MRLTVDLVEGAAQYIHPATRDRELDLRGYKIPLLENLGATLDQFDSIDFTDNDLKKLDGFPLLKRVKKLLLSNNRITWLSDTLAESLPNLEWIVLTNNDIKELGDIDPLCSLKKLEYLSLLNNPVCTKKNYRLYVIHKLPSVRVLDFRRVRLRERTEAATLFKGKKGKELQQDIQAAKSKTFTPGEGDLSNVNRGRKHTEEEMAAIRAAIEKADSLEEVERLQRSLRSGFIPGVNLINNGANNNSNNLHRPSS